ncbi:60Kd inner membrane protein-domain-containing protein [Syncephalis fuscata]|nr:60Kd inner membrane protein-domain-containing protein [Syncephalis fuscata]
MYILTIYSQPIQQINRNINKVISSNSLLHSSSNYCTKYVQQTALSPLNTRRVDVVTSQLIRITPIASISSSNSNGGIVDGLAWGLVGLLEAQQSLLISLHEAISFAGTACPWWATLMIGTVVVRTLFTLPIAIAQQRSTARLLGLQPMLKAWQETLARQLGREARDQRWHFAYYEQQLQRRFRRKVNEIYWQQRCHPAMGIAAMMIQIPLFISMSLAVRRLCHQPIPWLEAYFNNSDSNDRVATVALEMAQPEAGLLWWTDLTAIDPTLVLPVVIGLVHLANVELNAVSH